MSQKDGTPQCPQRKKKEIKKVPSSPGIHKNKSLIAEENKCKKTTTYYCSRGNIDSLTPLFPFLFLEPTFSIFFAFTETLQ